MLSIIIVKNTVLYLYILKCKLFLSFPAVTTPSVSQIKIKLFLSPFELQCKYTQLKYMQVNINSNESKTLLNIIPLQHIKHNPQPITEQNAKQGCTIQGKYAILFLIIVNNGITCDITFFQREKCYINQLCFKNHLCNDTEINR